MIVKSLENKIVKSNRISVVVTSFQDYRAINLIKELEKQEPFEIIIADGGSNSELTSRLKALQTDKVKFKLLPGNIAETRFQVQSHIEGEITVFIDTDESPETHWLEMLTEPILKGGFDFVFGSTKPLKIPESRYSRYLDNYDSYLYEYVLEKDILKGAMGNSAWKTELVKKIGFDPCLGIGGEDYDLTIRAFIAGYRGKYVKEAVVLHDQNSISTLRKFVKKIFYNYLVGASLVYRKNGMMFSRSTSSFSANTSFKDPLEIVIFLLKPFALIFSLMLNPWEDQRLCSEAFRKRDNLSKEKFKR